MVRITPYSEREAAVREQGDDFRTDGRVDWVTDVRKSAQSAAGGIINGRLLGSGG